MNKKYAGVYEVKYSTVNDYLDAMISVKEMFHV